MKLAPRDWVPTECEARVQDIAQRTRPAPSRDVAARITALAAENRKIHEVDCFNLNPATNVMNPKAEALLASGIGSRPSLGLSLIHISEPTRLNSTSRMPSSA